LLVGTFSLATAAPHFLATFLHTLLFLCAVWLFLATGSVMTRHDAKNNGVPILDRLRRIFQPYSPLPTLLAGPFRKLDPD
jgi:hypothetical protein